MINLKQLEVWFVTGSQHLYGQETLTQVAENSKIIAASFNDKLPVKVIFKPILTTQDAIHSLCLEANSTPNCIYWSSEMPCRISQHRCNRTVLT